MSGLGGENRLRGLDQPSKSDPRMTILLRDIRAEQRLVHIGLTLQQALRSRYFWTMGIAFLPMTLILGGQVPNVESILLSHSFSKMSVATLAPWMGLTIIAGRAIGGFLADLIWVPLLAAIFMALTAVSCFIFSRPGISYPAALAAVLLLGAAIGVEIDLTSYLTARYLGVKHYGLLYGILYVVVAIGANALVYQAIVE